MGPNRRLLIRPGAIGDCILSLPALEYLKTDHTEVWVPTAVVPLVTFADQVCSLASTGIDLVGVGELQMPERLRERLHGFDEIVSWYGAKRAEFRGAIAKVGPRCVFHTALPDAANGVMHAVDFFARQVDAPAGLRPQISIAPGERRGTVLIHPFSGGKRKNWPLERFRELAPQLGCSVEWIAGPEEKLADALRFNDLLALARYIAGARLYVGNDSGITHLAASTGVRTLALFGPTDPAVWGPRGENVRVLRVEPIEDLLVRDVLAVANGMIELG